MKTIELEKFIQSLAPEIYSFAYALVPLDMQASQLMIDSVKTLMIKNFPLIEKWKKAEDLRLEHEELGVRIQIYKDVFELAKQRSLPLEHQEVDENDEFYRLNFQERAALYLKEKTDFSLKHIEYIMDVNRIEVLAHLYSGRHSLATEELGILARNVSEQ